MLSGIRQSYVSSRRLLGGFRHSDELQPRRADLGAIPNVMWNTKSSVEAIYQPLAHSIGDSILWMPAGKRVPPMHGLGVVLGREASVAEQEHTALRDR